MVLVIFYVFTMKLVYNKKHKDPSYYIQHSYRIGKSFKTMTFLFIGKHFELLKTHPDPLAYAIELTENIKKILKQLNVKESFIFFM